MSTPVVMPQMGESIAEGTIVRWIKKVGDAVDRDEPLFEISTDKVDAEIPVAGGRRVDRHCRQGRRDGRRQQRRWHDRRGRRSPAAAGQAPSAIGAKADATGTARSLRCAAPSVAVRRPKPAVASPHRATVRRHPAQRHLGTGAAASRLRPSEVFAARAPHREGAQRRHRPHRRHGHRRPRHQAGHPRLSRQRPDSSSTARTPSVSRSLAMTTAHRELGSPSATG